MVDRDGPLSRTVRSLRLLTCFAVCLAAGSRNVPGNQSAGPIARWHVEGEGRGEPAADSRSAFFLSRANELVAIDADRGVVRWRQPLGAPQPTSGLRVAVHQNVVMAGSDDLRGFDATRGTHLWTFAPDDGYGIGLYLGATQDDLVYAGSAMGGLYAIDVTTGTKRWSRVVGARDTVVYAPAVSDGEVAAAFRDFDEPGDAGFVVFDAATGEERWRGRLPPQSSTNAKALPTPIAAGPLFAGTFAIVTGHDGGVYAFNRATGQLVWSRWMHDRAGPEFPSAAITDRLVVVGGLSGDVVGFNLSDGTERWRTKPMRASVAFAVVAGPASVYVPYVSGVLVALSALDGRERWRKGEAMLGLRWPPAVHGTRLYFAGSSSGYWAYDDGLEGG